MDDLIKRDDALNACALREDNPPTEMQLSLRNVISALPAIDPTNRIEQTGAKLTKAVEALRFLIEATTVPEANTCITRALADARAALAELEGK